jgi:hypothetical protein
MPDHRAFADPRLCRDLFLLLLLASFEVVFEICLGQGLGQSLSCHRGVRPTLPWNLSIRRTAHSSQRNTSYPQGHTGTARRADSNAELSERPQSQPVTSQLHASSSLRRASNAGTHRGRCSLLRGWHPAIAHRGLRSHPVPSRSYSPAGRIREVLCPGSSRSSHTRLCQTDAAVHPYHNPTTT